MKERLKKLEINHDLDMQRCEKYEEKIKELQGIAYPIRINQYPTTCSAIRSMFLLLDIL